LTAHVCTSVCHSLSTTLERRLPFTSHTISTSLHTSQQPTYCSCCYKNERNVLENNKWNTSEADRDTDEENPDMRYRRRNWWSTNENRPQQLLWC